MSFDLKNYSNSFVKSIFVLCFVSLNKWTHKIEWKFTSLSPAYSVLCHFHETKTHRTAICIRTVVPLRPGPQPPTSIFPFIAQHWPAAYAKAHQRVFQWVAGTVQRERFFSNHRLTTLCYQSLSIDYQFKFKFYIPNFYCTPVQKIL